MSAAVENPFAQYLTDAPEPSTSADPWLYVRLVPGTKRPADNDWQNNPLPAEATDPRNRGVHVGASRLVVVDEDGPEGTVDRWLAEHGLPALPPTRTHRTASGKRHFYYDLPDGHDGVTHSEIAVDGHEVDLLAGNRNVVAAGTVLADGRAYVVEDARPVAEAPAWLVERVSGAPVGRLATEAELGELERRVVDPDGEPCKALRTIRDRWIARIVQAGAHCHGEGLKASKAIAEFAAAGHRGSMTVMREVRATYEATRVPTDGRHPSADWVDCESGAWSKAAAKDVPASERCRCPGPVAAPTSDAAQGGAESATDGSDGEVTLEDLRRFALPVEFYERTPVLRHIRQAALSAQASPDTVLHSTLARVAALVPHRTRVYTGAGTNDGESVLNYFTAAIAGPGGGKTQADKCARSALRPWTLARLVDIGEARFKESRLGTGEGLLDAFMTKVEVPKTDRAGNVVRKKDGEPFMVTVREQTRHNVAYVVDEGRAMFAYAERKGGGTLHTTICELWSGSAAGQQNSGDDYKRDIAEGSYACSMTLGLQPAAAEALFTDTYGGAPQRFTYSVAIDPHGVDELVPWPGDLMPSVAKGPVSIHLTPAQKAEVRRYRGQVNRGELQLSELAAHEMLIRCRVAALLVLLHGDTEMTDEFWEMAKVLVERSGALRDFLAGRAERRLADMARRRADQEVRTRVRAARAITEDTQLQEAVDALVQTVESGGGELTEGRARHEIPKRLRHLRDRAVERALADGLLSRDVRPGSPTGGPKTVPYLVLAGDQDGD